MTNVRMCKFADPAKRDKSCECFGLTGVSKLFLIAFLGFIDYYMLIGNILYYSSLLPSGQNARPACI